MQKYIFLAIILSVMVPITTGASSGDATLTIAQNISEINTSLLESIPKNGSTEPQFSSAPDMSVPLVSTISYTSWEMIHRMPMLQGFMWTGSILSFISPQMYVGTPFSGGVNAAYIGGTNPHITDLTKEATSYEECIKSNLFRSFGLGERFKTSDIEELKIIAKYCAQDFYGKYFYGKSYTTREEFLMMLYTAFEEDVGFDGKFTTDGKYIPTGSISVTLRGLDPRAWYTPYVKSASSLGIVDTTNGAWEVGKTISSSEAVTLIAGFVADRMKYTGTELERGVVITPQMQYQFGFPTHNTLTLRIQ